MIYSIPKTTEQRRLTELISEVNNHPHKDELIQLMNEQIEDDKYIYGFFVNKID